jgi:hypothetical protein
MSALLHGVSRQLGGKNSYSSVLSLMGFTFLPFLMTVVVDLLEIGIFQAMNNLVLDIALLISGFFIPLILWPLALIAFVIQISQRFPLRQTVLTTVIAFFPWFALTVLLFL